MYKYLTYDEFVTHYKPKQNHLVKGEQNTFETYGEEQDYVFAQDPKFVWTEVDGEEGCYIIAGYHWVNRIQYYITNRPWEDENTEVPTWGYRDCECRDTSGNYEEDLAKIFERYKGKISPKNRNWLAEPLQNLVKKT